MSDLPPLKPLVLSATQIETADEETDFGCLRKWWFERVAGKVYPQQASAALGESVHGTLERYLNHEVDQGGLHDLVIQAPGALEYLMKLRPRVKMVEKKIDFKLFEVPITGRIDWVALVLDAARPELGDWKTTSVIGRYAKTAGQIKHSIQMNVYAAWMYGFGTEFDLRMTHGVFQTRGAKKFQLTSCEITKRENDARIIQVGATIDKIRAARKETDPANVKPDERKCNIAFGCPHRAYCPRSGEFNMASLLDAFKTTEPTPEVKISGLATPEVKAAPVVLAEPNQVLPSDAPKSNPEMELARVRKDGKPGLAIDDSKNPTGDTCAPKIEPVSTPGEVAPSDAGEPRVTPAVETSLPAPEEPKKRGGRPKGSKNAPKEFDFPPQVAVVPTIPSLGPVTVNKIKIRHGAKVGLPNFSSALVEVEMEGTVNTTTEEARGSLSLQVHDAMRKELEVYVNAKAAVEAKK